MYPASLNEGSDWCNNVTCANKDRNTIKTRTLSSREEIHQLGTKCQLEPSFRISWLQSVCVSWVSLYLIRVHAVCQIGYKIEEKLKSNV